MTGVVSDRDKLDTTIGADGMQKNYLVLSDAERAKGFVRPVRLAYKHAGRLVCGKPRYMDKLALDPGKVAWVCAGPPGHEGDCFTWLQASEQELKRFDRTSHLGGCDSVTTMGRELAETYAREPGFYGATFCVNCRKHLPVGASGEFIWEPDGSKVGT